MKQAKKQTNSIKGFDAHCHIFNLRYLLKEAKEIFFTWIIGDYPTAEKFAFKSDAEKQKIKEDFKTKLIHLVELLSATVRSEKRNFRFIQNQANEAWKIKVGAIPLMMDIFYIFAPPITEDDTDFFQTKSLGANAFEFNEDDFEKEYAELAKKIVAKVKSKAQKQHDFSDIEKELDQHLIEAVEDSEYKYTTKSAEYGNLHLSSGFRFHMDRLRKMVHQGEPIYPFFAVDPRREGIFDAIKNKNLISENGPFYGVKLYPRLGYHPLSKPVQDILDICIERDLPVITHCGMSGFPPKDFSFDGSGTWKYNDYGNPKHFLPAVKKGLRIDFAHLGSVDPSYKWAETIIEYINKYENVYSDLSCYTKTSELKPIIKKFWNTDKVKSRIMFGSDFDVMYFTDKKITYEQYCRNFTDLFPNDIKKMRYDNVKAFLKI
ncbi:MAG: amidohydrolase family protein [Salinivirgaceae bacterium]|nr:amidohydrolase family protein [Salinivirgaceae bacterium]